MSMWVQAPDGLNSRSVPSFKLIKKLVPDGESLFSANAIDNMGKRFITNALIAAGNSLAKILLYFITLIYFIVKLKFLF